MSDQYQTIFEIGFKSFPWLDWLHPCLAVVIGRGLYKWTRRQYSRAVGMLAIAFGIILFVASSLASIPEFLKLRSDYAKGHSAVIEGSVENFHPMQPIGSSAEYFTVNGVMFSYRVYDPSPCFHNAPARREPIQGE